MTQITLNTLVEKYVLLRDKKSQLKAKYDGDVAELDTTLDKIEAVLLKTFTESGMDSVKTAAGTAYKSTRTSVTVADWDAYRNHIIAHEAWELLEKRANKTAVEQYRAANDELPPGLNWREEQVVNVRRS